MSNLFKLNAVCLLVLACAGCPSTVYVNKNATGATQDGKSWATAFKTIQAGIDTAAVYAAKNNSSVSVWVARGRYDEARTSDPHGTGVNTGSVMMKTHVNVYGGFNGTETALTARDIPGNATIIDGVTSRDGMAAVHVVAGADACALDGFHIVHGNSAVNVNDLPGGGAIWNKNTAFFVNNCQIYDNVGTGAAALCNGGALVMANCNVHDNPDCPAILVKNAGNLNVSACLFVFNKGAVRIEDSAESVCEFSNSEFRENYGAQGASIYCSGKVSISGCTFSDNSGPFGGTVANYGGELTIANSTFAHNDSIQSSGLGAAVYTHSDRPSIITNCIFKENHLYVDLSEGGAVYGATCDLTISNCVFEKNTVNGWGGAVNYWKDTYTTNTAKINNCIFTGNTAKYGGAACGEDIHFTNCLFVQNEADTQGGAIQVGRRPNLDTPFSLVNCCLYFNVAAKGESIYAPYAASGNTHIISNCILWDMIDELSSDAFTVQYSDIWHGWAGAGNISSDPLFVSPPTDFTLQVGSPCIDAGTSGGAPGTDINGIVRPQGAGIDMGPYER